jgi:hypothetical protein
MKDLLRRLERVEGLSKPADEANLNVCCAHLKALPRDYAGEKHRVLVKGWPYEFGTEGECQLEERPGPGPDIDFGFNERTILVTFVSVGEEQDPPEHD